jgi:hypothetical protein
MPVEYGWYKPLAFPEFLARTEWIAQPQDYVFEAIDVTIHVDVLLDD